MLHVVFPHFIFSRDHRCAYSCACIDQLKSYGSLSHFASSIMGAATPKEKAVKTFTASKKATPKRRLLKQHDSATSIASSDWPTQRQRPSPKYKGATHLRCKRCGEHHNVKDSKKRGFHCKKCGWDKFDTLELGPMK